MRYRALDANGDMTFGKGQDNFLANSPACVAQAVLTALRLAVNDWFLDVTAGIPYATQILGNNTKSTRDQTIKAHTLAVQGVNSIKSYSSDVVNRQFSVQMTIDTIYGEATISFSAGAGGFQGSEPWVFR